MPTPSPTHPAMPTVESVAEEIGKLSRGNLLEDGHQLVMAQVVTKRELACLAAWALRFRAQALEGAAKELDESVYSWDPAVHWCVGELRRLAAEVRE